MAGLLNFTNNLNRFFELAGGKGSSFIPSLATAVGVTPRTIHKLLAGTEPSLELALKISRHLGFSLETGKETTPAPVIDDLAEFKAEALVALLRATPAQWRTLRPALTAAFPRLATINGSNKEQPSG
jgi:DNA-binding XRE family transcriptional regulator